MLALAWQSVRGPSEPLFWEQAARNRKRWTLFTEQWLQSRSLAAPFYPDLTQVDLHGRKLLHTGDSFLLLPMMHPPVDTPYDAAYEKVEIPAEDEEQAYLRIATDGSSIRRVGGAGVCILPPYGDVCEHAVILQKPIDGACTNIRAEIVAACQGLRAILTLRRHLDVRDFLLQTDSMHVVNILQGAITSVAHAGDVACLLGLWSQVHKWVRPVHVKAHTGHPLNELADLAAKAAALQTHALTLVRNATFSLARFVAKGEELSPLHVW